MRVRASGCLLLVLGLVLAMAGAPVDAGRKDEPNQVVVQHLLIGFGKKVPNKQLDRSKAEAKALAVELLERAQAGEDFDAMVQEYTDDRYPGIYTMANKGQPKPADGFTRDQMAPRFGDVAFDLKVGEVGLAIYHPAMSPYGYHVIKRLE
jgi:foldase protein PrsA